MKQKTVVNTPKLIKKGIIPMYGKLQPIEDTEDVVLLKRRAQANVDKYLHNGHRSLEKSEQRKKELQKTNTKRSTYDKPIGLLLRKGLDLLEGKALQTTLK